MSAPFAGTRILDFSTRLPGALATMLFADFGADVVRVAQPGDAALRAAPGFLCWDRNKRRVELDVRAFAGLEAARGLLAAADVAVFDTPPGELEALGLDAATLLEANPRLLHAWLPPYAAEGRWSSLPADELLLQGITGISAMQASFDGQPVALVTPQVGYAQATIAANGIAAGLWERRTSGRGQALTATGLHAMASIESGSAITGDATPIRLGRSSLGGVPFYRLYRCAHGEWFFLGTLTAPFFIKALEAIGLTDLLADPAINGEFTNFFLPPGNEIASARLEARFAEEPREHWLRILHEAGVPRGPVGVREEWFRDETVAANEMRLELDHPKLGRVELPGLPVKLEDTPGEVRGFCEDVTLPALQADWQPRNEPVVAVERGPAVATGRPLEGVRILDLGAFIAGTFAPTVLASYGADIIKVEPLDGDPYRTFGLLFFGHNLGKRSVSLDLKHPAGRRAFDDLVRQSDVVLDNFRLGVRERLGIDYATLSAINPRIITCSVTGYGPKGRLAADPGFDPLMQARSGMMRAQGGDAEPVFHQIAVNDTATAMLAAFGMQAALAAREVTGRGQEVHTCLANASVLFQSADLTLYEGRPRSPLGGRDFVGPRALERFYACADGWLGLSCHTAGQFQQVAIALGHPEWTGRMTAEHAAAEPGRGELAALIAEALAAMPRAEALDRLLTRGVPAAPVAQTADLFTDPWFRENHFFAEARDPLLGRIICVRTYADWSRSTAGFPRPGSPGIGEHSLEVLAELGFEEGRVADLLAAGALKAG